MLTYKCVEGRRQSLLMAEITEIEVKLILKNSTASYAYVRSYKAITDISEREYVYTHIYIHTYVNIYECIYINIYHVCMYIYIYTYTYIHTYIYTHI